MSLSTEVGGASLMDKRNNASSLSSAISTTFFNATKDIASMRTALAAANGTYYTATRLDQMTANDMIYALRLQTDAAGV